MKYFLDPWTASTAFTVAQGVRYNNNNYYCLTAHTSTSTFDGTKFRALVTTDNWTSKIRSTIYSQNFVAVDAVYIEIPGLDNVFSYDTPLRFCSGGMDIVLPETGAGNRTYTAQGDFLGFSTVPEDFDIKVGKFDISLSGLSSGIVDRFSQGIDFEGCQVTIQKVFLDYTTLKPINGLGLTIFDGVIFNVKIVESAVTCTITIECATLWADYERTKGRKTNNESNWLYQNGNTSDTCFSKTSTVGQTEFRWGKK